MSMRPIDLQSALNATKEVEKIQQASTTKQQQSAAAVADTLEVSRQKEATQVQEVIRVQTDRIKEREGKRDKKKRRGKTKSADPEPEEQAPGTIYNPNAELEDLAPGAHRDLTI
jgi:hypothetical protein